jgi:hypothetical protein
MSERSGGGAGERRREPSDAHGPPHQPVHHPTAPGGCGTRGGVSSHTHTPPGHPPHLPSCQLMAMAEGTTMILLTFPDKGSTYWA